MKQKLYLFISFIVLSLVTGCVEETGYYEPGEKKVIVNLTADKSWERKYVDKQNDDLDTHEIWIFKDDGTGSSKYIRTDKDGKTTEFLKNFRWSFTMPNYSVIYLDSGGGLFWDVKELTADKLHIVETYEDPVTVHGQLYREEKTFKANPLSGKQ